MEHGKRNLEGFNMMAREFQKRMQQVSASPPLLEFGTIQAGGALMTNSIDEAIPATDYTVLRSLTIGKQGTALTRTRAGDGDHEHSACPTGSGHTGGIHEHTVLVPEKMRSLSPGDSVLVAWVGSEAVVIDIILPAEEAFS